MQIGVKIVDNPSLYLFEIQINYFYFKLQYILLAALIGIATSDPINKDLPINRPDNKKVITSSN